VGALVAAVAAVVALATGSDGREYRIVFSNAGQLVAGDMVRIGGTPAGTVEAVELTDDNQAAVRIRLDEDRGPLREGTTATIRAQGLVGVASRYVDISPAPTFKPALPEGATIPSERTQAIVEVDQLFNALDPETRKGLQRLIDGSGDWYAGREQQANQAARYFGPAVDQMGRVAAEIIRDSETFEQFLIETGDAMAALADRRDELTELVGNARQTARALAADTDSLSTALRELPPAVRAGADAMVELRPAIEDLRRLVEATGEGTRELTPFLRELRPVLDRAVPTFRQLRAMIDTPGAGNDALDGLRDLPPLARQAKTAFPRAQRALDDATPMFRFIRPYIPDTIAWLRSFGGAMAPYDANGHYARTLPVFDAYRFIDDAEGGRLEPKPPPERGRGEGLSTGNLRRCPGAAAAIDDGSGPFVDSGPEANPDCDPSQAVGRTP
jgi:phospholipid/cholesterol/gamma-HCH transport system substrate-binding protein